MLKEFINEGASYSKKNLNENSINNLSYPLNKSNNKELKKEINPPYVEIYLNSPEKKNVNDNELNFKIETNADFLEEEENNSNKNELSKEDKKKSITPKNNLVKKGSIKGPTNVLQPKKNPKVIAISKYTNKVIRSYITKNNNKSRGSLKNSTKQDDLKPAYVEYFYSEDKNSASHKAMEDFHCISENLVEGIAIVSMFSIFDGHGGPSAAIYCKDNFTRVLSKSILATGYDYEKSLSFSFNKINSEILSKIKENDIGTTASTVLLVRPKNEPKIREFYCGNVGDSKIYLLKKSGKIELMSKDHNCNDPSEVERIKSKGGLVFQNRVFGSLMLTRTLGDKEMKKYGVICEPFINKYTITEEDNYIILASDGIWDMILEEDLSVYAKEEDMGAKALSKRLVMQALEKGSSDNISCIAIKL